jgi:hypothetical protein
MGAAIAAFWIAAASSAAAQERWAALSVLGDRISVVYPRGETGTRLNPNLIEAVKMEDDVLDRLALRAVVQAQVPGVTEIVPLALRDARFYEAQERLLAGDARTQPLLESLLQAVAPARVTHLLVVAKLREEASFRVREGHIGIGRVEGLGFYVDRLTRIQRTDTLETDTGFLAPFAYYRLLLFDIGKGKVVAEERVTASTMYVVAGSREGDPWRLVSAEKKVEDLERLLNQHTRAALYKLQAARRE